jgi:hypothetical protein
MQERGQVGIAALGVGVAVAVGGGGGSLAMTSISKFKTGISRLGAQRKCTVSFDIEAHRYPSSQTSISNITDMEGHGDWVWLHDWLWAWSVFSAEQIEARLTHQTF